MGEDGSFTIGEMGGTCVIDKDYNVLSDKVHMVMDMRPWKARPFR